MCKHCCAKRGMRGEGARREIAITSLQTVSSVTSTFQNFIRKTFLLVSILATRAYPPQSPSWRSPSSSSPRSTTKPSPCLSASYLRFQLASSCPIASPQSPTPHGQQAAFYIENIPPELQLSFIFANYERFVKTKFRVNKKNGDPVINRAIMYSQIDYTHSFSRHHKQVSFNIVTACIIRAHPRWDRYVIKEAHQFCSALISAWIGTVTR